MARKLHWLSPIIEERLKTYPFKADTIQIDESFSIEHTKLKPLSIALAVSNSYEMISVQVGRVPATGPLSGISRKKYGARPSERPKILETLFLDLREKFPLEVLEFVSDQDELYPRYINKYFPHSVHKRVSSRAQIAKKKELMYTAEQKKVFDPMFALNHTAGVLRDHIKRLARRNWCTTKRPENLERALRLYQAFTLGLLADI